MTYTATGAANEFGSGANGTNGDILVGFSAPPAAAGSTRASSVQSRQSLGQRFNVAVLQSSTDLINWNPLTWSAAPSQSGVATGFIRYTVADPINPSQNEKFDRLKLNH